MSAQVEVVDKLGKRLVMEAGDDNCVLRVTWGISESFPQGKGELSWNSDSLDKIIEAAIEYLSP